MDITHSTYHGRRREGSGVYRNIRSSNTKYKLIILIVSFHGSDMRTLELDPWIHSPAVEFQAAGFLVIDGPYRPIE